MKEDTVVEKSLKNLKNVAKPKPVSQVPAPQSKVSAFLTKIYSKLAKFRAFMKEHGIKGLLRHMWEEMKFYKDGFKLFWKDLGICIPLSYKYLTRGRSSLTRREYRLVCILYTGRTN